MDILHLVDRLEQLLNEGRAIPLTRSVIIDEDRLVQLIDQLRVSIPDEVRKAQQLLLDHDRVRAQANEQAARTVAQARDKAEQLVVRDAIVQDAGLRAKQIVQQAERQADATREDADTYVIESLSSVEAELLRLLNQVRNGIGKLKAERGLTVSSDVEASTA